MSQKDEPKHESYRSSNPDDRGSGRKKCMTLDDLLHTFFAKYARVVHRFRWLFILIPLLVSGGLSYGFVLLRDRETNDTEYVYTPTNGRGQKERAVFRENWPLDPNRFIPDKDFDKKYFMDLILTARDGGSVLRRNYLEEIAALNGYLSYNFTISSSDTDSGVGSSSTNISYQDICLSFDGKCFDNFHVGMLLSRDHQIRRNIKMTYPRGGQRDVPIYFGNLIGGVVVNSSTHEIMDAGAVRLLFYYRRLNKSTSTNNRDKTENGRRFMYRMEEYFTKGFRSDRIDVDFLHTESLDQGLIQLSERFRMNFTISVGMLSLFAGFCSFVLLPPPTDSSSSTVRRRRSISTEEKAKSLSPTSNKLGNETAAQKSSIFISSNTNLSSGKCQKNPDFLPTNLSNTTTTHRADRKRRRCYFPKIDWVRSKPLMAVAGLVSAGMAIVSSFGLLLLCGMQYYVIATVMPFLIISIGIDDMFIMSSAWHRTFSNSNRYDSIDYMRPGEDRTAVRMGRALAEAAVSITITSLTDALSFGVGCVTVLPGVSIFCSFAAVAVLFDFLYQITFFAGIMSLLGDLEASGRHCLFFFKCTPIESAGWLLGCLGKLFWAGSMFKSNQSQSPASFNDHDRNPDNNNHNDRNHDNNSTKKSFTITTTKTGHHQPATKTTRPPKTIQVYTVPLSSSSNTANNNIKRSRRTKTVINNDFDDGYKKEKGILPESPSASSQTGLLLGDPGTTGNNNGKMSGREKDEESSSDSCSSTMSCSTASCSTDSNSLDIVDEEEDYYDEEEGEDDDMEENDERGNDETIVSIFFRDFYGPVVLHPVSKFVVLIAIGTYVGFAAFGCLQINEGLDPENLIVEEHYLKKYFEKAKVLGQAGVQVHVAVTDPPPLEDPVQRADLMEMLNAFETIPGFGMGRNGTMFWLLEYIRFLDSINASLENTRKVWVDDVRKWVQSTGGRTNWEADMIWINDSRKTLQLTKYRFQVAIKNYVTANDHRRVAEEFRSIADRYHRFGVVVFEQYFPFADQYRIILPMTLQNIGIAISCMILVSLLMIPSLACTIMITLAIISIDAGVLGYMSLWSVNLDAISMITIIMSIGFAVDLTAHISYAFVKAGGQTSHERALRSLETVGWPVFQGAFSTIIGILILCTVKAYMMVTFFKTVLLVIVFGLLHSLVFIPVILTIITPDRRSQKASFLPKSNNLSKKRDSNKNQGAGGTCWINICCCRSSCCENKKEKQLEEGEPRPDSVFVRRSAPPWIHRKSTDNNSSSKPEPTSHRPIKRRIRPVVVELAVDGSGSAEEDPKMKCMGQRKSVLKKRKRQSASRSKINPHKRPLNESISNQPIKLPAIQKVILPTDQPPFTSRNIPAPPPVANRDPKGRTMPPPKIFTSRQNPAAPMNVISSTDDKKGETADFQPFSADSPSGVLVSGDEVRRRKYPKKRRKKKRKHHRHNHKNNNNQKSVKLPQHLTTTIQDTTNN